MNEEFISNMEAQLKAQWAIKEAKRIAAKDKPKARKKTKAKKTHPHRVPVAKYSNGTKLAAFFENVDLYKHLTEQELSAAQTRRSKENAHDKKNLRKGWKKDGATYNGEIVSTHVTESNKRMYRCIFEKPTHDPLDLDEKRTKTLMEHYIDLQDSSSEGDGLSSSDESTAGNPHTLVSITVGTAVRKKVYSVGSNYESLHTFYDGEVFGIRHVYENQGLKAHEYKCVFPAQPTLDNWYNGDETQTMAKEYLDHHASRNDKSLKKATPKKASTRLVLSEVSAMVGRVTARPVPYSNGTRPDATSNSDGSAEAANSVPTTTPQGAAFVPASPEAPENDPPLGMTTLSLQEHGTPYTESMDEGTSDVETVEQPQHANVSSHSHEAALIIVANELEIHDRLPGLPPTSAQQGRTGTDVALKKGTYAHAMVAPTLEVTDCLPGLPSTNKAGHDEGRLTETTTTAIFNATSAKQATKGFDACMKEVTFAHAMVTPTLAINDCLPGLPPTTTNQLQIRLDDKPYANESTETRERKRVRKAAEKEAMKAWQVLDTERLILTKNGLRKAYKENKRASKLRKRNIDDIWERFTGLKPDSALVPKDDAKHALHVRIQQFDSFVDVVEYEALHKILQRSLAGIPIDSDASDDAMLAKIAHRKRNKCERYRKREQDDALET
jgi:hypothetical protein